RLAALAPAERAQALLTLVVERTAKVLGHAGSATVDPGRSFADLGMDSLAAIQLRNTLTAATGLALPAGLVFDHPTPAAVAAFAGALLWPDRAPDDGSAVAAFDRLEAAVRAGAPDRDDVAERLERLLRELRPESGPAADEDIGSVPVERLFAIIDQGTEL
ncbi:acyl carrier protein, partial [Frankia sp. R82]|uniref:acyl carrier protein n=1 Tax=Frankia sp. R82 TaxID=2950553 RepID=UPI002043AD73